MSCKLNKFGKRTVLHLNVRPDSKKKEDDVVCGRCNADRALCLTIGFNNWQLLGGRRSESRPDFDSVSDHCKHSLAERFMK